MGFSKSDYGIVVIKPGFAKHDLEIGLDITHAGLEVTAVSFLYPCPEYARLMYPKLMAEEGEARTNISNYMGNAENDQMVLLIVEGSNAMQRLNEIKGQIKEKYAETPPSKTRNVVHMPENETEMVSNAHAILELARIGKAELSPRVRRILEQLVSKEVGHGGHGH